MIKGKMLLGEKMQFGGKKLSGRNTLPGGRIPQFRGKVRLEKKLFGEKMLHGKDAPWKKDANSKMLYTCTMEPHYEDSFGDYSISELVL